MEIFIEAIEESLIVLPVLFIACLLLEYISNKDVINKVMNFGKVGPFIASILGSIPQCGFSVIAAKLFSMKYLTVGTLISIFIATSDEAFAILMAHPDHWQAFIMLILLKIIVGALAGFIIDLALKKRKDDYEYLQIEPCDCGCQEGIFKPAIRHALQIFVFILLTNLVFGAIVEFVGADVIKTSLQTHAYLQPLIAGLVGFIPNCAGSVILTQLYVSGGLTFGALFAGLTTSAGVGTLALIRYNENKKQTFMILGTIYIIAIFIGYILTVIF